jgi:hypothetical protein
MSALDPHTTKLPEIPGVVYTGLSRKQLLLYVGLGCLACLFVLQMA